MAQTGLGEATRDSSKRVRTGLFVVSEEESGSKVNEYIPACLVFFRKTQELGFVLETTRDLLAGVHLSNGDELSVTGGN